MKSRLFAILAFVVVGIVVAAMLYTNQVKTQNDYDYYVNRARAKAEEGIPFVSVQNYMNALKVKAGDEGVYNEYLAQCEILNDDYYVNAVKEYTKYFPESPTAYETLTNYYYENNNYSMVIKTALEAKELGLANDNVKAMFLECSVKYRTVSAGFDQVSAFLGDNSVVKMDEMYGYISPEGYYLMRPCYKMASYFFNGNAAICDEEDKWYMINQNGYMVAKPDKPVDYLSFLSNNQVLFSKNGKWDYMDSSLKVPEKLRFDLASNFKNNVAAVKKGTKWALINTNFENITDYIFDDIILDDFNTCISNGVIFAKTNGKYYMYDGKGNRIADNGFDNAQAFASAEPAAVCVNGKWGFVDTTGSYVIEPKYEDARSFSIGLGGVCKDGKWGYINNAEDTRIDFQFLDCIPFSEQGVTAVIMDEEEKWSYIKLYAYIND